MPIDDAYLAWLYGQIGSVRTRTPPNTYWKLLELLHAKEFTWSIEKDGNRAQDGIDLRSRFLDETGRTARAQWKSRPCTFLEMLVALAWAVAFEGGGNQKDRFWELIDNLGLTECNDLDPPDEPTLNMILDKVIYRDYAPNGAGGLFPLSTDKPDQRDVELWYQANAYLLERL